MDNHMRVQVNLFFSELELLQASDQSARLSMFLGARGKRAHGEKKREREVNAPTPKPLNLARLPPQKSMKTHMSVVCVSV